MKAKMTNMGEYYKSEIIHNDFKELLEKEKNQNGVVDIGKTLIKVLTKEQIIILMSYLEKYGNL